MHSGEVQLDELLVKLGTLLAERVNDVLEVSGAHVGANAFEVGHRGVSGEGFDFLEVGDVNLRQRSAQSAKVHPCSDQRQRTSSAALRSTSNTQSELSKMTLT